MLWWANMQRTACCAASRLAYLAYPDLYLESMAADDKEKWADLAVAAGSVFTPSTPIDARALFAGREEQTRLILDVINQRGQHAMLYGERGVGKTSLANILPEFLRNPTAEIVAPRINCDSVDTFDSVWRKAFESIELSRKGKPPIGFGAAPAHQTSFSFAQTLPEAALSPEDIRRALTIFAQATMPIFIIDEFDRLSAVHRRTFADTIKSLSDHSVGATVILVGVADGVEQLLEEHRSVERALVQVPMPRMSEVEIKSIITTGVKRLEMTVATAALRRISRLAQGLPHYAHLLGLYACRSALDDKRTEITTADVDAAVKRAIRGAQQSIIEAYDIAVRSPRKDTLFGAVLLACAMAETNELGFFAAQDVRKPLQKITHKEYGIPSFAQHLNEFCEDKRGSILKKDGTRRRFRYRFVNPLLQPFVIMRGIDTGLIASEALD